MLVKENPRKPGTVAHDRFAKMTAFVKKNPRASVAEVFAATGYAKADLEWDEARGAVKTDVITEGRKS